MPCVARGLSRLCPSTRPWTLSIASHRSCTAPPAAATGRARPTSPPGSRTRTSTLAGFARPAWTRLSASPRGRVRENRGQAQRVELDVVGGEGRRDPRREGGGGGHRRRPGAAPGAVRSGRDGPGAPLGHIGEQTFRPQDAQGLADGAALHAELRGQLGLRGLPPARRQPPGPDPGAQLVGHLPMCRLGPLRSLPPVGEGAFRLHDQTPQLLAIFGQFTERWL